MNPQPTLQRQAPAPRQGSATLQVGNDSFKRPTTAAEMQDFVRKIYGGQLPQGVVDELIAERRREALRER